MRGKSQNPTQETAQEKSFDSTGIVIGRIIVDSNKNIEHNHSYNHHYRQPIPTDNRTIAADIPTMTGGAVHGVAINPDKEEDPHKDTEPPTLPTLNSN